MVTFLISIHFDSPRLGHTIKTNCKEFQSVDPTIFYIFTLYNILYFRYLLIEILGNMCIVIIYVPIYEVVNFEINLSSLIKLFFYVTKKLGQNLIFQERKEFLR